MNDIKRKSYILLGSPRELEDRKLSTSKNIDFLLINVSGACNHNCFFCWTHDTYPIKNKSTLDDSDLTLLLKEFHKSGGKTCAIMSDGEPLFSVNFKVTKKIVELTGKLGMNMLLFTNGELLNAQMIKELSKLNSKISFVVSVNASTEKKYDKIHGIDGAYQKVIGNLDAWKNFTQETNQIIKKDKVQTQFAIHFVVNHTSLDEIPEMQKLANELNCALIIASPGMSGRALLHEDEITKNHKELEYFETITKKYSDTEGPTAKTYKNECAYISSSRNKDSFHGITIHSLGGMVLVCPYFVGLGSDKWFELKSYFSSGGKDISKWLTTSEQIAKIITDTIFKIFGYNYCLKRHPRYSDIEKFIIKLNQIMKVKTADLEYSSQEYFDKIVNVLKSEIAKLEKTYEK